MSYITPKYPILDPLPTIQQHDQLPSNAIEIGRCIDTTEAEDLYVLVKHQKHLIILVAYRNVKTQKYFCKQYDFPLKTLSWFPKALEEFRKPPAEGGLHAGAMISKDVDIDGEMLAVGSYTDGYYIVNRSRNGLGCDPNANYDPVKVYLNYEFLYRLGFLDLWKTLGDKYARGEI